jgi:hypothetical protein
MRYVADVTTRRHTEAQMLSAMSLRSPHSFERIIGKKRRKFFVQR